MKKKKKEQPKVKVHFKWKSFFLLLFFLGVVFGSFYYLYQLRIQNIYVEGNFYLRDKEILEAAQIRDYPKMFRYSTSTIEKNIEALDLINAVNVKKNLWGTIKIKVEEAKPLFYSRTEYCTVLSSGKRTNAYDFSGLPFLVNYVPDAILERFIKELSRVKMENISLISEIFYSPSMSGDITIDDTRFLLRMNDGNEVYINLINIDRLNTYPLIYTLFEEKGILELDSDNERVVFRSFKSIEENKR